MLRRDSLFLSICAVLIVTPASFALGLYWLTRDPTLRPLSITHEAVSTGPAKRREEILTIIQLPGGGRDPALEEALKQAFDIYDTGTRFRYEPAVGNRVQISFRVAESLIGPFSLRRAPEGIRPAIEAQRLVRQHSKQTALARLRERGWLARIFSD